MSCLSNCFKAKVGGGIKTAVVRLHTFVSQVAVSSRVACAAFKVKLASPPPRPARPLLFASLVSCPSSRKAQLVGTLSGYLQMAASLIGYILVYLVGLMV